MDELFAWVNNENCVLSIPFINLLEKYENKSVIKMIDLYGREFDSNSRGFRVEMYNDLTFSKVYKF